MKRIITIIFVIVTAFLISMLSIACFQRAKPSEQETLGIFGDERGDFEIVTQYLEDLEYSFCVIDTDNGEFFAKFDYHEIDDISVVNAVKRLWKKGCTRITRDDEMNSISFQLWHNNQGMACGMLTCIRENEDAQAEFMTEIKKTNISNWYYYVSDYNKWRVNNQY